MKLKAHLDRKQNDGANHGPGAYQEKTAFVKESKKE